MILLLTGASSSIVSSGGVPQDDPMKSLGGYVSNSPVPNGAINSLFDLVSLKGIKDATKETIAVALINKHSEVVTDVSIRVVCSQDNACSFKIAAVSLDNNYCMEHIDNRYSQPMLAEFHEVNFNPASVDVEIVTLPQKYEEVDFSPFDVTVTFSESNYDAVISDIIKAFSKTIYYRVKRLSEKTFRILLKDDGELSKPFSCSYLASDDAEFKFSGLFDHASKKEVLLSERLEPNEGIGLWIQREILNEDNKSELEMIDDYNKKITKETVEEVELAINYNIEKS